MSQQHFACRTFSWSYPSVASVIVPMMIFFGSLTFVVAVVNESRRPVACSGWIIQKLQPRFSEDLDRNDSMELARKKGKRKREIAKFQFLCCGWLLCLLVEHSKTRPRQRSKCSRLGQNACMYPGVISSSSSSSTDGPITSSASSGQQRQWASSPWHLLQASLLLAFTHTLLDRQRWWKLWPRPTERTNLRQTSVGGDCTERNSAKNSDVIKLIGSVSVILEHSTESCLCPVGVKDPCFGHI